jgi:putative PEP-CTERM system TPR-repeat lipoprotein
MGTPLHVATLVIPDRPSGTVGSEPATPAVQQVLTLIEQRKLDEALSLAKQIAALNSNDPGGFNVLAAVYIAKGDYKSARDAFDRGLAAKPDDIPLLLNLGRLDLKEKKPDVARSRFEAVLAQDPKNLDAMFGMAQATADSNNERDAVGWLQRAKSARPESLLPRIQLARYYIHVMDHAKALSELNEALEVRPNDPDLLELLGDTQMAAAQREQALRSYRQLALVRPDSATAHFRLATAQMITNRLRDARESLKKALQLKPDYVEALEILAALDIREGRYDDALKSAKQVQVIAPQSASGFSLEGDIRTAQRRPRDALKSYQSAFALSPLPAVAIKRHATQVKIGDAAAADAELTQYLATHPKDVEVRHYIAGVNFRAGKNQTAIDQYNNILQIDPKNAAALNNLALLYQREKDPRALPTAESALKAAPQSSTTEDTLGWILIEQGQSARGLELLRSAAAREPKNPSIQYHLAAALAKAGNAAAARDQLKTLLARKDSFPERDAAQALMGTLK